MAVECLTTATEQWIRDKLQLQHPYLGDVHSISLPGTYQQKIRHLGNALNNFVCLRSLDLSYNALVSTKGVGHLKVLERLILYSNRIPSLEEVKELYKLPALRKLDLRLNPLTKRHPFYRLHLVHTIPSLCELDGCSVRETERKAALMQFHGAPLPQQKSSCLNQAAHRRWSDQRLALGDHLTKRQSLLTETGDDVLNFHARNEGRGGKKTGGEESRNFTKQRNSTSKEETAKSILRYPSKKYDKNSEGPHMRETPHQRTDRPKVLFGACEEKQKSEPEKQNDLPKPTLRVAKGHYTPNPDQSHHHNSSLIKIRPPSPHQPGANLSDPSDPILHPPRLTYSGFNKTEGGNKQGKTKKKRGSYRTPLEMLLEFVDKHWKGERSLHHNNNFLTQAVHILSMMEKDISSREAKVRTLKQEVGALNFQAAAQQEEHKTEMCTLSAQLEEARSAVDRLNEQLRTVLQENLSLQKQLIKLERQHLTSVMKSSLVIQIEEVKAEVLELRKVIEGLREKVKEAEKVKESPATKLQVPSCC